MAAGSYGSDPTSGPGGPTLLTLALLCWPFGALAVVLLQGRRGYAAVPPFTIATVAAFGVTGLLLVMALLLPPETAVTYLFYGTATFGGTILSGVSALTLLRFAQRADGGRRTDHDDDPGR